MRGQISFTEKVKDGDALDSVSPDGANMEFKQASEDKKSGVENVTEDFR